MNQSAECNLNLCSKKKDKKSPDLVFPWAPAVWWMDAPQTDRSAVKDGAV